MQRLPRVHATRYVTALREGGSLPGLIEADDLGTYVVKFTGAGQGKAALVAEVVASRLATGLGLATPDLALITVDPALARGEPDQEVQELVQASPGTNLAVDFLPGAFDLTAAEEVDSALAGRIVLLDALINNVDRSWRNPNLLWWHGRLWLIDHGASLTFLHSWQSGRPLPGATRTYDLREHALHPMRPNVEVAAEAFADLLTPELVASAVAAVPAEWLPADELREVIRQWLEARWRGRDSWLPELIAAACAVPGLRESRSARPGWLN
ncbi:MAG: HipA family kinase [Candidatus Nanopelagicales bacterium]